jgi:hypothetical protein
MHIHGNSLNSQLIALGATQGTQQAMAARKAAAEVRRKLTTFAATEEDEVVSRAEARSGSNPDRRQNPQQDETQFRSVFFSASV